MTNQIKSFLLIDTHLLPVYSSYIDEPISSYTH